MDPTDLERGAFIKNFIEVLDGALVPHQIDSADLERFGRHVGELRGMDVTREPELCGDCDNEQIVLTADDFDGIPRCEHRSYRRK